MVGMTMKLVKKTTFELEKGALPRDSGKDPGAGDILRSETISLLDGEAQKAVCGGMEGLFGV